MGKKNEAKVTGILLQIQRNIKLIDNWSNKTYTLRNRIQRTAIEALEPANRRIRRHRE